MWTRQELKLNAKAAFKQNYWRCVLAGLIWTFATGCAATYSYVNQDEQQAQIDALMADGTFTTSMIVAFLSIIAAVLIISFLFFIFIRNPLVVSVARFFKANSSQRAELGEFKHPFSGGRYLKTVGTLLLEDIIIALFSILLIIPGIVKCYDYYLVKFILADEPELSGKEALRKSKEMMRGHRWNTFVLNLSFIPWYLLGGITLGLVNIFYVMPYVLQTDAQLYLNIKGEAAAEAPAEAL